MTTDAPTSHGAGEALEAELGARLEAQIRRLLPHEVRALSEADNLIEWGLDSLHILRLVNDWRREGVDLTFAELIEEPSFARWRAMFAARQRMRPRVGARDIASAVAEPPAGFDREAPFALTDVQHAYWIGRADDRELGGVGCHAYLEIEGHDIEPARLEAAWQRLFEAHPMLRARFGGDGDQRIPKEVPCPRLAVHDLRHLGAEPRQRRLEEIRSRLSHRRLHVERGEVIGLELSRLPEGAHRLHLDVDLLIADVQSLHVLLRDLAEGYRRGSAPAADPRWHFGQYLAREATRHAAEFERARQYWHERLAELPEGPRLPVDVARRNARPVFQRRQWCLDTAAWRRLRERAGAHRVTPAMVLACAYGEVLARWSAAPRFCLNVPLFDRNADDPGIEHVVADFTNLLLLECDFGRPLGFAERVSCLSRRLHTDVAHARYSAVRVQRDLARLAQRPGVMAPVVFACNLGTPLLDAAARAALGDLTYMISQTPQVWLDHQVYELDGGLLLAWDAVEDLFPAGVLDAMFAAYCAVLTWASRETNDWSEPASVYLPAEQASARERVNATEAAQRPRGLHADFFERAEREPERCALIYGTGEETERSSYGALARQALQVARLLREAGVRPGEAVGVSLRRGMGQVAAVLGVLAAGGCYVPVGVHQPAARRAKIHRTAGVRVALVEEDAGALEAGDEVRRLTLEEASRREPLEAPVPVKPESVAYVIFTSGSTGEPKGVEVSHRAAINTIDDVNRRYGVGERSRVLAVSSLDFDLSVYDVFGLLGVGGSVVLVAESERRDAAAWLRASEEHGVTVWNSVPVLLDMLLVVAEAEAEAQPPARSGSQARARRDRALPFEQVLLSGDWIGLELPERLHRHTSERTRLYAMGGATEAAIWSNVCEVTVPVPKQWTSIPYGKPLANQRFRVVDAQGRDCPDWVAGELWIGGAGVAEGYRNDAALTAERFVEHAGQRWYRTGDRGRYWPDGTLEFLGREDQQVKVRGHRIELGEIEAALSSLPEVGRAVALTLGSPPALAAAVELKPGATGDEASLSERLRQVVPEYMVPSLLSIRERLPLSDNGKLDRKRLATELADSTPRRRSEPPRDELERQVAEVWSEVLRSGSLSRDDDFFQIGGDSLSATRIVQVLRQRGVSAAAIPLRILFSAPTVATLSEFIRADRRQRDRSGSVVEDVQVEEGSV